MRVRRTIAGMAAAVVIVTTAACEDPVEPPADPGTAVTVVNLNAAMGYKKDPGDPAGTDATPEDLALLADDITRHGADVAHLQEMAEPAARDLRERLTETTGDEWQLNWATSGKASYYAGKDENEKPSYDGEVNAGNAQLIRIGAGIRGQKPITLDGDDDQGIVLPSSGRSFVGAEITTARGAVDLYNTHLARPKDATDDERVRDVARLQEFTEARTTPAIITGDFNETIEWAPGGHGQGEPKRPVVEQIRRFMTEYGYTDVARDKGPTSDQKKEIIGSITQRRIDFILARGVGTRNTEKFESHESDHWGLVTTLDPGPVETSGEPSTSDKTAPADRYRQEAPYTGEFYYFRSADGGYSCGLDADQAVCQGETTPVPPRPASCYEGVGWGYGMSVDATGKAGFVCAGGVIFYPIDREPNDRDTLPPGQSFSALGFTCAAEESGIRCTHEATRHGFAIAAGANEQF
jgi:endonuclease/exonuclease/phosphatase family metal-dependent hydrolase